MTAQLTTATPAEIDREWFPLIAQAQHVEASIERTRTYLADPITREWQAERYRAAIARLEAETAELTTQAAPYEAEWNRRGGWTRYPLVVTSGKGHVHRNTNCSTTYLTTQFVHIADASGLTEDELVEQAGEDACTVCFPGAPVQPRTIFTAHEKVEQAAKAQRDKELAAKAAAKASKAITNPDGTELREAGRYGTVLSTEVTARNTAVGYLSDHLAFNYALTDDKLATIDAVVAAIAAKHDTPIAEVRADIQARAVKKAKRDKKESEKIARSLGFAIA